MKNKAGLYFHIPFCFGKCPYCDFYSVKYTKSGALDYAKRLIREMKKYSGTFDTVYFGGGTPSVCDAGIISEILMSARKNFDIDRESEITVECNPSKNLKDDFIQYISFGINRISIGMQSAVDKERFALGRAAGKNQVEKTIEYAKNAGIENISLDIMLGTPGQTLDSLDETFDFIDKMNVRHISAYMLKIEEGTPFYRMKDRLDLPDEDTVCEMYLKTVNILDSLGLHQYEISNFAASGFESRHNLKYWKLDEYLGIGKTAHSFMNKKRFFYDEDFNLIPDGDGGSDNEKIMLGLRLCEGVDKTLVKRNCDDFISTGLMRENNEKLALTPQGMLVSNSIICELIQ